MTHFYGLPYKGSKSRFCKAICDFFPPPPARNFFDVFGGGGAMTHYAMLHQLFDNYYYNDINSSLTQLFDDAIIGNIPQLTWVSRSTFKQIRFSDMFSSILFSFGCNCTDYFASKDRERKKHGIFNAVMYNDYSSCSPTIKGILSNCEQYSWSERYQSLLTDRRRTNAVEPFHRYRRILSLQSLRAVSANLNVTSLDYRQIEIPDNSIVYCDIPYDTKNRKYPSGNGNLMSFDYPAFYEWARSINHRSHVHVFISSSSLPDDRFKVVHSFNSPSLFCSTGNSSKSKEYLYVPRK